MPIKPLSEINRDFCKELAKESDDNSSDTSGSLIRRKAPVTLIRVMSDMLFYLAILVILYSVISFDVSEGKPRSIMGYSYFTVMSSSMRDEIPKGSLIITRKTPPGKLKVFEDITFMRDTETTVTHRIVEIISTDAGERAFRTMGVNNAFPDDYIVASSDVLGKVIIVLPGAGAAINSINENIHILLIMFLLCSLLSFLLRGICTKKRGRAGQSGMAAET